MNPIIKRYLISSLSTFLTVAALTLGAELTLHPLSADTFTAMGAIALLGVAVRAGIKAIVEGFSISGDHPAL